MKAGRYRYWGDREPVDQGPIVNAAATTADKATMRIYGPIDNCGAPFGVSAEEFGQALTALGDVKTIDLHLHSPGGHAFEGTAIKNQLQQHPAKVNVIVDGLAASAASMIAMAGDTVTMAPSAQMVIHDASALVVGQSADMKTMADRLDSVSQSYAEAYAAKAGGTVEDWRAAMQPETWYTAQEAVDAGLADGLLPAKPSDLTPKAEFDLSIFAHAGRSDAPPPPMPAKASTQTPADAPVHPPTKGAVVLTDTEIKALTKCLDLPEDADAAAVLAKAEDLAKRPEQTTDPAITDEAIAAAYGIEPAQAKAALEAAKAGKVTVSQSYLDTIEANAKLGAEARAEQMTKARDEAINAKVAAGIISRDQVESWQRDWDRDPASAKAELDKLTVARFPVGTAPGTPGSAEDQSDTYTEDMAAEDAAMFGLPKEAFAR